jgi:hypothetical protein
MELVMIEVAALEVQERIKTVDASFTWPHPTDKGYFVSASFIRLEDDRPYLVYCPRTLVVDFSYSREVLEEYINDFSYVTNVATRTNLTQEMCTPHGRPQFYIIPLGTFSVKEVKKEDVEKMFGIKVV